MDKLSNNCNSPSFNGVLLGKTKIFKRSANGSLENVHFVEMDSKNPFDKFTLSSLKNIWASGRFTEMICSKTGNPNDKIYALTTQADNFEQINPNKVVSLACGARYDDVFRLRFLQTKYDEYKHAGKATLLSIADNAKINGVKTVEVFVEERIKPFYRKVFPNIQDKPCTKESSANMILKIADDN